MTNITYRIHPAIGVMRLGNAERDQQGKGWYLASEIPGTPSGLQADGSYIALKDEQGKILAQGARFKLFRYADGQAPVEVNLANFAQFEIDRIEWQIQLANRKSGFFSFYSRFGKATLYSSFLHYLPFARRNANIKKAQRDAELLQQTALTQLDTHTRAQLIDLANGNPHTQTQIPRLGQIKIDDNGHFIVLAGYGNTCYRPELNKNIAQADSITDYANNNGWYDDICDGPITATVHFKHTDPVTLSPEHCSWVMSAPPDYAPAVPPIRSYWDSLIDQFVRNPQQFPLDQDLTLKNSHWQDIQQSWNPKTRRLDKLVNNQRFKPSFNRDIYPILTASFKILGVFSLGDRPIAHQRFDDKLLARLGSPGSDSNERQAVFARIRSPYTASYDMRQMPFAHGDVIPFSTAGGLKIIFPLLAKLYRWLDLFKISNRLGLNPSLLTVSPIQYALLQEWAAGNFIADRPNHTSNPLSFSDPLALDIAGLQHAVGGAFFPGIEAGWLFTDTRLYQQPFRVKHQQTLKTCTAIGPLKVEAGLATAQMALPWQADFADCRKKPGLDKSAPPIAWWPSQRPDNVFRDNQGVWQNASWTATIPGFDADNDVVKSWKMVNHWSELGFVIEDQQHPYPLHEQK